MMVNGTGDLLEHHGCKKEKMQTHKVSVKLRQERGLSSTKGQEQANDQKQRYIDYSSPPTTRLR